MSLPTYTIGLTFLETRQGGEIVFYQDSLFLNVLFCLHISGTFHTDPENNRQN